MIARCSLVTFSSSSLLRLHDCQGVEVSGEGGSEGGDVRVLAASEKGCEERLENQLLTLLCLSLSVDRKTRLHNPSEYVREMADGRWHFTL